ncbi:MAG: MerR family transcriptional regulator [Hydrogenophilales bacterium]|nr:MerR family transcriptional regulator [Hydrogenophilales bacterium]
MNDNYPSEHFPIRELVKRTGVNASTLRAWENRHGLIVPARTHSGHRLYSEKDVQRVRRLQELLAQGLSLNEIADVLESGNDVQPATATPSTQTNWQGYFIETLRALEDFSTERLDALYNEACALYPIDTLTQHLLIPVLQHLGTRWDSRESGIAEEHFFSAWLRNKLGARLHHSAGLSKGKSLVLACLPHEHHEIGLLLFALGALHRGFRVVYLGTNVPIRQIVHVVQKAHTAGIVLSGRDIVDPAPLLADIAWLSHASRLPLFVGSHFAVQTHDALIQQGALPLGNHIGNGLNLVESYLAKHGQRRARQDARPVL